ncbi:MAG: response regulator [Desulfobulbaceae bacterium]|nr:response regulator [Desulfobulbaceae bacterium]
MKSDRLIEILLVEDNPADIMLMEEVLSDAGIKTLNMHAVNDGEKAMAYLHREGIYVEKPLPDLVILDLNIPKKHGHDVLREIKEDEHLQHIPVIIMTTSQSREDILKSYRLHANCYIVKPIGPEEFIRVIKVLETFWFQMACLPSCV